mmetsp:Transcript_9267/g.24478  ORF Transcript_9267/g.24478 Transcript_9267/m.24478 type:complete len:281 (+) Transcript_9267:1133-1975(+)
MSPPTVQAWETMIGATSDAMLLNNFSASNRCGPRRPSKRLTASILQNLYSGCCWSSSTAPLLAASRAASSLKPRIVGSLRCAAILSFCCVVVPRHNTRMPGVKASSRASRFPLCRSLTVLASNAPATASKRSAAVAFSVMLMRWSAPLILRVTWACSASIFASCASSLSCGGLWTQSGAYESVRPRRSARFSGVFRANCRCDQPFLTTACVASELTNRPSSFLVLMLVSYTPLAWIRWRSVRGPYYLGVGSISGSLSLYRQASLSLEETQSGPRGHVSAA